MSDLSFKQPFAEAAKPRRPETRPFSIRLTDAERAELKRRARNRPLGTFIRDRLLGSDAKPRKAPTRMPSESDKAWAQALAGLGKSRLASNLNQIARLANQGALPVTPELQQELQNACDDIRRMRLQLIKAMGMRP